MKRKLLIVALLLIIVLCGIVLIACNPDGTDKASSNAEFVSFRKKIVTILKDNGIFVNDLDKSASKTDVYKNMVYAASSLNSNGLNGIADILLKDEYKSDGDGYDFAVKQIYTVALQMSLCLGDGIINYFGEETIYNIPVYIPDVNMVITEQDNTVNIYSYQKYNNIESMMKIEIVFENSDDYYFTVVETGGDWIATDNDYDMYFYGNSQKEFLMYSHNETMYTPNGADFYQTGNAKTLSEVADILGDVFKLDVAEYRKIDQNVKHRFTQEQFQKLNDKYFKDVQSSVETRDSEFVYENINGKRVLTSFVAGNGETEVVIPSDTKYMSEQFVIEDLKDSVKTLVIPASIEQLVDTDGNVTGDWNYVRIDIMTQNGAKLLENITVKQGSKLFKSGQGHLTMTDGFVVYALDKTLDKFDLNVLARATRQEDEIGDGFKYNKLFKFNGTSVDLDYALFESVSQDYGLGGEELLKNIYKVFNNSAINTYNIAMSFTSRDSGKDDPNVGFYGYWNFDINLKRDIAINVTFDECKANDDLYLNVNLINSTSNKHNVTVNTKGFSYRTTLEVVPKQPQADKGEDPVFVSNDKIFTTFNLDVPTIYYEGLCVDSQRLRRDEQNSTINFDTSKDEQYRYYEIVDANTNANHSYLYCALGITNDVRNGDKITIPQKLFGLDVVRVRIDVDAVTNKQVTVILNNLDNFDRVEFYSSSNAEKTTLDNADFVISVDCEFDSIIPFITNYDSDTNYAISFTLRGTDKTEVFQTGWEYGYGNPDNERHEATFWYEDRELAVSYSKRLGVVILEECEQDYAYFAFQRRYLEGWNSVGQINVLDLYRNDKGQLCCSYEAISKKDEVYYDKDFVLVKYALGVQSVKVAYDKQWSVVSVNLEAEFAENSIDGKTYFTATVSTFNNDKKGSKNYDDLQNQPLFEFFDCNYTKDYYDASSGSLYKTETGGTNLIIVCAEDRLLVLRKYSYINENLRVNIGNKSFNTEYKNYEDSNYATFNVDTWGLEDIDNYVYYFEYKNWQGEYEFSEVHIYRQNGSVYATTIKLNSTVRLVRLPIGQYMQNFKGDNFDITLNLDLIKPELDINDNGLFSFLSKSQYTLSGNAESYDIEEYGFFSNLNFNFRYLNYGTNEQWSNFEWQYSFDGLDLQITGLEIFDEFFNLQINIEGQAYSKNVLLNTEVYLDGINLDERYVYYISSSDGRLYQLEVNDGVMSLYIYDKYISGEETKVLNIVKIRNEFEVNIDGIYSISGDNWKKIDVEIKATIQIKVYQGNDKNSCRVECEGTGTVDGKQITEIRSDFDFLMLNLNWEGKTSDDRFYWIFSITADGEIIITDIVLFEY